MRLLTHVRFHRPNPDVVYKLMTAYAGCTSSVDFSSAVHARLSLEMRSEQAMN